MNICAQDFSHPLRRLVAVAWLVMLLPADTRAYPLDGTSESGIARLLADAQASQAPGALLNAADIRLRLLTQPTLEFDAQPADPRLLAALTGLLKSRDPSYAIVIVDFTDPEQTRWAGLQPDLRQNPGSVGKILCMLALFDALAYAFPDVEHRQQILRSTRVTAGDWVRGDSHAVPHFDHLTGKNRGAILQPADVFYLSEWIDHAISASANGAGSVIWREAMLLRHFGASYPADEQETRNFFARTPKAELSALGRQVISSPIQAAGLDPNALMQGSFWTQLSKGYVPGGQSFATPRELARFMVRLEQGRLVDPWSSLMMKKFMYITKRRYRYVYAPELRPFATYFKSGSLYQCRPEEGFRCGKYMGNVRNLMNSVTTVEALPDSSLPILYAVALMSNVLRVNSAWDHSRIAAAVHQLLTTDRPVLLKETAAEAEIIDAGKSD